MTLRGCLTLTLLTALSFRASGERWSRQVSNSEWIPLANPRSSPATQLSQPTQHVPPPLPSLALPPALQHQYQQQLLQLQKTQENIQKLLLLQQQLRAQQQLLQSQTFIPSGFSNQGDEKPVPTISELGPEVLVPPVPSSEALPPIFPPQDFLLHQAQEHLHQRPNQNVEGQEELSSSTIDPSTHGFKSPQYEQLELGQNPDGELTDLHDSQKEYVIKHEAQEHPAKRPKGHTLTGPRPPVGQTEDDNEEVQLIYVPAETLAQRGQPKRVRGRKYHYRQQQHQQQQQREEHYHHQQQEQNQRQHEHQQQQQQREHEHQQQQQQRQHDHQQQQQQRQQDHQQQQHHHQSQLSQQIANDNRNHPDSESSTTSEQDAYARSLIEELQREREEKKQFLKEERMKEINRLNEEQRALERKVRLQQEAIQREQEIQRQRDAEKKKKELEKLEEMAKQRELQRIREAREKQRQEEIERRRLAEVRAKEERRKEEERLKQEELLRAVEEQRRAEEVATTPAGPQDSRPLSLPLVRESANSQLHRQHHTETSKPAKRFRGRQRQRAHQYHSDQTEFREASSTTPSPNQPPLSVYMGASTTNRINVKVTDVLKILKDAKTIAVLDTVGPDAPQVFVGPTSLEPPVGYAKFDLPYLSSIDHNRVERKVDKLPFFVAPLSFDPPPGYSKIPFPAPHIGSVVVNTIDATDNDKDADNRSPNPTPLIEPNSYIEGPRSDQNGPSSTTPTYESPTSNSPVYTPEASSTPRYEPQFSTSTNSANSAGRFRFRQFYGDSKPASVISTSYHSEQLPARVKQKPYYEEGGRSSTPRPTQNQQFDSTLNYGDEIIYSSTPSFEEASFPTSDDPTTKEQDLAAQLALINQELAQHRNVVNKYNGADQYHVHHRNPSLPTGPGAPIDETNSGDINDVRSSIGPTHYSLPSELPAISPLLPGLVNSLIDKHESALSNGPVSSSPAHVPTTTGITATYAPTTTPRPITTMPTTMPPPTTTPTTTTTYRPRGRHRGRIVSTRPPTTQAPTAKANDRTRRPYSRSRSRYTTTTTEDYRDSAYESTKARVPETTQRYNGLEHHSRRPSSRSQKYRSRERNSQSELAEQNPNVHRHQETYDHSQQGSSAISAPSAPSGPFVQDSPPTGHQSDQNLESRQPSSSLTGFSQDFQSTSPTTPENFPQQRPVTHAAHHGSTLAEEYARGNNYPRPEDLRYHLDQSTAGFDQENLEKSPVNGFNYQAHGEAGDEAQKDFPYYAGKLENTDYGGAVTTEEPRTRTTDDQSYSTLFAVRQPQFEALDSGKIGLDLDNEQNTEPIFVPLPEGKQQLYGLQQSTETAEMEATTEAMTTTQSPVIIRQRVRGRGRQHQDSAIQTRPRGSQDEYVRVSAVNRPRDGTRTRSRVRPQSHSQIQTDGYDYVKIHAAQQQQQRAIVTTTPAPITTTTPPPPPPPPPSPEIEEDIDYGFIRPPSFRPVHPIENRFHQQPVTFRPLAQIQSHVSLTNDETAVESSPSQSHTQLYKNRPKYQHAPGRRPSFSNPTTLPVSGPTTTPPMMTTTTMTTTTSTESPTLPTSNTVYTVRPKTRPSAPEEQKTRIRGRIRRPGRRRTTTTSTTESGLDANNELPPDENYPRIYQNVQHSSNVEREPAYDENFEGPTAQFLASRDRTGHLYDVNGANYANEEFVLNFGNAPDDGRSSRDEYDQTQLASDVPRRYQQHPGRSKSSNTHSTPIDIYGAESQWSTKLTKTSFQPSFAANRVPPEFKDAKDFDETPNAPEIITAGPEISSVTLLVSADGYNGRESNREDEESMIMATTVFGKKTTPQYIDKPNATFESSTQSTRERSLRPHRYESDADNWSSNGQDEGYIVDTTEITKVSKKAPADAASARKAGRRKRVRVRVRPVADDFVTAESQHYNSAVNSLGYDQYKYNPIREYRLTTTESPSISVTAEPTVEPTRRSVFQDFLEEMLKTDEAAVPVLATSTSTELPPDAWQTSLPTFAAELDSDTTLKELSETTMPSDIEKERPIKAGNYSSLTMARSKFNKDDPIEALETLESFKTGSAENDGRKSKPFGYPTKLFGKEKDSGEDLNVFGLSQKAKMNDLRADSHSESDQSTPRMNVLIDSTRIYAQTDMAKTVEYPKNHREKWSEVRYPSAFDRSRIAGWNYESASPSISGLIKNKNEANVKSLSDYVKAIFDTMKNAEETGSSTERKQEATTIDSTLAPTAEESTLSPGGETTLRLEESTIQPEPENVQTAFEALRSNEGTTTMPEATDSIQETTIIPATSGSIENKEPNDSSATTTTTTTTSTTDITTQPATSNTSFSTDPTKNEMVRNSTESTLGKVLRTSTTTKVSHMTEICYRGRCVMTKPKQDDVGREERIAMAAMGKKEQHR